MKSKIGIIFFVVVVVFGVVAWMQSRQNQALDRELTALRLRLEERTRERQADEALKQELTENQETLHREVRRLTDELQSLRANAAPRSATAQTDTSPPAGANDSEKKKGGLFGDALAKMMEDPAMKKMMRQQQMAMMDTMYGPLFKQLGLSPEEIAAFKEKLIDTQMGGVEGASAIFGGEADPAKREEAIKSIAEKHKAGEEQLKEFLGEDRYGQYKDYQETLGERMTLNQFQQQLSGGENALAEDQNAQLLAIMKEERKNSPAMFGADPNAVPDPAQFEAMLSEEKMNQHFEQQEQLNQRILERARAVLNQEQLESLTSFQKSQIDMQRFGMQMAIQFMGGEKSKDTAPVSEKP
ncbi:MAG TPA: hypothetical protein VJW76_00930 [Verrucomicrobiae bacterium]|nr:hypothetical protein [Verrucomicrobiae bacterium]